MRHWSRSASPLVTRTHCYSKRHADWESWRELWRVQSSWRLSAGSRQRFINFTHSAKADYDVDKTTVAVCRPTPCPPTSMRRHLSGWLNHVVSRRSELCHSSLNKLSNLTSDLATSCIATTIIYTFILIVQEHYCWQHLYVILCL